MQRIEIERIIDLPDGTKWYKPKDSEEYTKLKSQRKINTWMLSKMLRCLSLKLKKIY